MSCKFPHTPMTMILKIGHNGKYALWSRWKMVDRNNFALGVENIT